MTRIIDPKTNQPFRAESNGHDPEAIVRAAMTYAGAIARLALPSTTRAADPFGSNPWVFMAAVVCATNASSSPYVVYQESDESQGDRMTKLKALKRWTGAFPSGQRRRAVQRHCQAPSRRWGITPKGLEPDWEHPLMDVLLRPNPIMSGAQLWFLTHVWFALKGEAFWLLLDAGGKPTSYMSGKVAQIWPVNPNFFEEKIEGQSFVGWSMRIGRGTGLPEGQPIPLLFDEVVHFMLPDPVNPLRGLNPLAAESSELLFDAMIARHNLNLLNQGGIPPAVLMHEGPQKPFRSTEEEDEFRKKWMQKYGGGVDREREIGLLTGGWKYAQVSLSPREMEFRGQKEWNRDVHLGTMQTPKSILSITDGLNYAIQLSQDRNFWDKNLIPKQELMEITLDSTLLYNEPDTVVGQFDRSRVEALKVGISDKVQTIMDLCGPAIHMPPRQASEVVGLELPAYEGEDVCMIPQGHVTLDAAMDPPAPPAPPQLTPKPPDDTEQDAPVGDEVDAPPASATEPKALLDRAATPGYNPHGVSKLARRERRNTWRRIVRTMQQPYERKFARSWRGYAQEMREEQLRAFDAATRAAGLRAFGSWAKTLDVETVMLDLGRMREKLRDAFRPIYSDELEGVFNLTAEEVGGVAEFGLDAPQIQDVLDAREDILVGSAPDTLQENMRRSLRKGIERGETVQQLRERVARSYDIAAGSGRALTIARTESAGFMNEVREEMFKLQGFEKVLWLTAMDEHVRAAHRTFGNAGPQVMGFNYMTLLGSEGSTLTHPGDFRGPAGQVVNCRCCHVPA